MKLAIQTKNLTKSFDNQSIVRDLNLSVPEGSLYAFIGPNGAGKTTTMRMLLGLIPLDKGTILFNDKDIKKNGKKNYLKMWGVLLIHLPIILI